MKHLEKAKELLKHLNSVDAEYFIIKCKIVECDEEDEENSAMRMKIKSMKKDSKWILNRKKVLIWK